MNKRYRVRVNGKEYEVEVEEWRAKERPTTNENLSEKKTSMKEKEPYGRFESITTREKSIYAPMPARVIRVNCKAGERVRRGDILIVLEAMKMENEIPSPNDGTILEVRVEEGKNVSQDDIMVIFE